MTDWERKNRNGYNAHLTGKLQSDNPYFREKDTARWDGWNAGWMTAEQHSKASPEVYSFAARKYQEYLSTRADKPYWRKRELDAECRQRIAAENT